MPNYFIYYFPKDVNYVFYRGKTKQNIRLYFRASIALFENSSNKNGKRSELQKSQCRKPKRTPKTP